MAGSLWWDIGRSHAVLYLYDMALQCVFRTVLPDHGGDGNELLTSISDAIFQGFSMEELHAGKMKSIGLLFQDDTEISEFRVMYSTGYTAATISLREALFTQFKVPIVEEYSRVYTVSRALAEAGKSVGSNYAHTSTLATGPWCRSCRRNSRWHCAARDGRHHRSAAARRRLSAGAGAEL